MHAHNRSHSVITSSAPARHCFVQGQQQPGVGGRYDTSLPLLLLLMVMGICEEDVVAWQCLHLCGDLCTYAFGIVDQRCLCDMSALS